MEVRKTALGMHPRTVYVFPEIHSVYMSLVFPKRCLMIKDLAIFLIGETITRVFRSFQKLGEVPRYVLIGYSTHGFSS